MRRRDSEQTLRATQAPVLSPTEVPLHAAQLAAGTALTRGLLQSDAGTALAQVVAEAERPGVAVELGLQVAQELADLPWETLRLPADGVPGPPLVLLDK